MSLQFGYEVRVRLRPPRSDLHGSAEARAHGQGTIIDALEGLHALSIQVAPRLLAVNVLDRPLPHRGRRCAVSDLVLDVVRHVGSSQPSTTIGWRRDDDPLALAVTVWSSVHGLVTLWLGGFVEDRLRKDGVAAFARSMVGPLLNLS